MATTNNAARGPIGDSLKTLAFRLLAAARRNVLFSVLFITGAALRLLVVLAYQPVFMLQKDTYTYLHTAVNASGSPNAYRPALYSLLFLKPILLFDNLAVVPIVQHTAGLAMSLLLYMLLRRLSVAPILAALGTAPLLLDGYQLDLEH